MGLVINNWVKFDIKKLPKMLAPTQTKLLYVRGLIPTTKEREDNPNNYTESIFLCRYEEKEYGFRVTYYKNRKLIARRDNIRNIIIARRILREFLEDYK